jgi:DnaB helicase-like protein/AAA domain-containing protein
MMTADGPQFLRRLPHNVDAEHVVIGTVLFDDSAWPDVAHLTADDFMIIEHRAIWMRISAIKAAGQRVDPVLLKSWSTAEPLLDHAGGHAYVVKLASSAAPRQMLASYAHDLADCTERRRMIDLGQQLVDAAYAGPLNGMRETIAEQIGQPSIWQDIVDSARRKWSNAASIAPENIDFLWPGRFIANSINLVAGMGDVGKDVFCCTVAACVTTGNKWPDGADGCEPGMVGIIAPEDVPANTIVPRLIAAGANLEKVRIWTSTSKPSPNEVDGLSLLIVSPLITLMAKDQQMNSEQDARDFLELWQGTMKAQKCTVLGTAHLSKKNDVTVVQRILGASGIANFVRSNWAVQRDDEDKTERLFMRLKANLSPDEVDGLKFRIDHIGPWSQSIVCVWCGTTDKTPDEVMKAANGDAGKKSAGKWLMDFLTRRGGMAEVCVINENGEKEGFSNDALRQAQHRNPKILAVKHGFGECGRWWWQISEIENSNVVDGL